MLIHKFIFILTLFLFKICQAYIPPSKMILQRLVDNSGAGTYVIEQEVQFTGAAEPIYLKETWVVENEKNMRVTVTGTKDLKDSVRLQIIYSGGQKWWLKNKSREGQGIPNEFLERIFHYRSVESLGQTFFSLGLLPQTDFLHKKINAKKVEDFKNEPEAFVRLSRSEGVVNYAFGKPTPPDQKEANAGLWIEQDQFNIRKIRLQNQIELTAENYANFSKGLMFPKSRSLHWDNQVVNFKLLSLSSRPNLSNNFFQPTNLDVEYTLEGLSGNGIKEVVEEFYSRFR